MKFKVGDVVYARFEKQYGVVYEVNEHSAWPFAVKLFGAVPTRGNEPWRKLLINGVLPSPPTGDTRRVGEYVPNELRRAVVSFVGPVAIEENHATEIQDR